jgi:glycerophosphoryl diester phosphodiesterase
MNHPIPLGFADRITQGSRGFLADATLSLPYSARAHTPRPTLSLSYAGRAHHPSTHPSHATQAREQGLAVVTYGLENSDAATVLRQQQLGVAAAIVDDVAAAMPALGRPPAASRAQA